MSYGTRPREMAAGVAGAIQVRLTVVLKAAEPTLENSPNRSAPRVLP
jgi:hypothetical protein